MKKRTAFNSTLSPGKGFKRPLERSKAARTPKPRKPTGEAIVFEMIARDREHKCEACGRLLHALTASNFSHLLPKGSYPRYRLLPENIRIKCAACHDLWHNAGEETLRTGHRGNDLNWNRLFDLRDKLRLRYNTEAR
jgi:5-methylcytosine-specific restriction endonuclease McrA